MKFPIDSSRANGFQSIKMHVPQKSIQNQVKPYFFIPNQVKVSETMLNGCSNMNENIEMLKLRYSSLFHTWWRKYKALLRKIFIMSFEWSRFSLVNLWTVAEFAGTVPRWGGVGSGFRVPRGRLPRRRDAPSAAPRRPMEDARRDAGVVQGPGRRRRWRRRVSPAHWKRPPLFF